MMLVGMMFPLTSFAYSTNSNIKTITNGVEFYQGKSKLRIEFVTPTIVRVQYQPEGKLDANDTAVCLPRKKNKLRVKYSDALTALRSDSMVLKSAWMVSASVWLTSPIRKMNTKHSGHK